MSINGFNKRFGFFLIAILFVSIFSLTYSNVAAENNSYIKVTADGLNNNAKGNDVQFFLLLQNNSFYSMTVEEIKILKDNTLIEKRSILKPLTLKTLSEKFIVPKEYFNFVNDTIEIKIKYSYFDNVNNFFVDELSVSKEVKFFYESTAPWLGNWYSGDLHLHTTYSDGVDNVYGMAKKARDVNLDFIFVTDHTFATLAPFDNLETSWENILNDCNEESTSDFLCIRGEEIGNGASDHYNLLGTTKYYNAPPKPHDADDWNIIFNNIVSNESSLFGFVNHPYAMKYRIGDLWRMGAWEDWNAINWNFPRLQNIEVCNYGDIESTHETIINTATSINDSWVEFLLDDVSVVGVGNSDAHLLDEVGKVRTYVCPDDFSQDGILDALTEGRAFFSSADTDGNIPKLSIMAKTDSTGWKEIGETLKVVNGETVTVKVNYYSPENCTIELKQGVFHTDEEVTIDPKNITPDEIDPKNITPGEDSFTFDFNPTNNGYIRAQLKTTDSYLGRSWTNPIWLNVGPNTPPREPLNFYPANGAADQSVNTGLSWIEQGDPDGDSVTYDVYLEAGDTTPDTVVATDIQGPYYNPTTLATNTTYYWKVVASDGYDTTESDVWSFTTGESTNNPPNTPTSPDPADGDNDQSVNTTLSWTCSDPDGDPLTYDVYLEEEDSTPDTIVAASLSGTSFDPGTLEQDAHYYWKVVASDGELTRESPVWDFETEEGAELSSFITIDKTQVSSGQQVNVSMTVVNTGGAQANSVRPAPLTVNTTGTASANKLSGPSAPMNIPAGGSREFTWTFLTNSGDSGGTVSFSGNASGVDGTTSDTVSSSTTTSDPVTVQVPAELDADLQVYCLVNGVRTTQSTISGGQGMDIDVVIANTGQADAVNVMPSLIVNPTGTVTIAKLTEPSGAPIAISGGTSETFTWSYTANAGDNGGTVEFKAECTGNDVNSNEALYDDTATSVITVETPAELHATLELRPTVVNVNGTVTISLSVTNTGQADALGVAPALHVTGDGALDIVESPIPEDVPGLSTKEFVWTCNAKETGEVNITGDASGIDENSALTVTSPLTEEKTLTINAAPPTAGMLAIAKNAMSQVQSNYQAIVASLPEEPTEEMEQLLDQIQDHMENATGLTNPIYATGELSQALALMNELSSILA